MQSDGMTLYNLYREALAEQGVGTDPWDSLYQSDKDTWQATAEAYKKILAGP